MLTSTTKTTALRATTTLATATLSSFSSSGTLAFALRRSTTSVQQKFDWSSRSSSLALKLSSSSSEQQPSINGSGSSSKKSQGDDRSSTPRTGWNHNLPSKNSDFWIDPSSSSSTQQQQQQADQQSSSDQQLRTGWLHNSKPAEQVARDRQQRKLSSSSSSSGKTSSSSNSNNRNRARERLERAMKLQQRNHRILSPPTFLPCGPDAGRMAITEHVLSVPLVRGNDDARNPKQQVQLYFTVVEKVTDQSRGWLEALVSSSSSLSPTKRAELYVKGANLSNADSLALYLQGGPGFGAPTPAVGLGLSSAGSSWAAQALLTGSIPVTKVVLMDQRGTGRSTPVTKQYLEQMFPDLFLLDSKASVTTTTTNDLDYLAKSHPEESVRVKAAVNQVADFLSNFRADNIVKDAEEIRDALLLPLVDPDKDDEEVATAAAVDPETPRPWGCVLGQSFGGFCLMTYLSLIDHPPRVNLFTGGIAPMLTPVSEVYETLWERVRERSYRYYELFPGDIAVVKRIVRRLIEQPEPLPSGGVLTARRFLQLGLGLGSSPSSFPSLHAMINTAFLQTNDMLITDQQSSDSDLIFRRAFLKEIETQQSFDDAPFYFWLHESIYADSPNYGATQWAAHRAYEKKVTESSDFDYTSTCVATDPRPVLWFGEMVFPWMSQDYGELQGVGLTCVAQALADKSDWPPLYNADAMRAALNRKNCKAAAAVYHEDLYVDFDACLKVAKRGGPLEQCKLYVTNEFQHSGLRDDGANLFSKLYGMATGSIRTPS